MPEALQPRPPDASRAQPSTAQRSHAISPMRSAVRRSRAGRGRAIGAARACRGAARAGRPRRGRGGGARRRRTLAPGRRRPRGARDGAVRRGAVGGGARRRSSAYKRMSAPLGSEPHDRRLSARPRTSRRGRAPRRRRSCGWPRIPNEAKAEAVIVAAAALADLGALPRGAGVPAPRDDARRRGGGRTPCACGT